MRKHLLVIPVAVACVLAAAPATAAPLAAADVPSFASAQDDKPKKAKPKAPKSKAPKSKAPKAGSGSAKGGNPPAHSNGKGRAQAPGQLKKAPGAGNGNGNGNGQGEDNANPRSENENKKVTYCHVPPGNPDNGHLITTSVNAIDPGHTNHPGDIIPPFTFVKHGETVSFPGQNWGPDAQAILDNGCRTPATEPGGVEGEEGGLPGDPATDDPEVKGTSLTADASDAAAAADEGFVDGILPSTGGARLGLLLAALALLGVGGLLLRRRAATA